MSFRDKLYQYLAMDQYGSIEYDVFLYEQCELTLRLLWSMHVFHLLKNEEGHEALCICFLDYSQNLSLVSIFFGLFLQ